MISKFTNMTVSKSTSLKEVLFKINKNGKNGVFVVSKSKNLFGVITDSDIRKSLLKKSFSSKKKAKDICQRNYFSIPFSKEKYKKKLLLESNKILIPILRKKKLVNFIHTSDLTESKKEKNEKILVIGGLGYIGSVLVKDLLNRKFKVNILDTNYYGCYLDKKTLKNKNLKVFYGDCKNKKKLKKSLKHCSDVIHLGEIVGDPAVNLNENFSIKNNFENTVFVVSECIKNKINKFIFASSCSVYGDSNLKCKENSKLNPVSLYAKCKIECEKSILSFKSDRLCPVILRLSTVYGDSPRKRFDLVVNRFVLMALKKIKIQLYGENAWRPFISVNDVSRLLIKVLDSKKEDVNRQIFNVGSDKENYRIIDIIKTIKRFIKIDYEKSKIIQDKRNYKVSFKKIKKILKFDLKHNLRKSIFNLLKKYKRIKIDEKNINYYNDKKIHKLLRKNLKNLNYI
tara:strand:- start:2260 stop:3624 length:1365 start_codon:yes stop_codon:yes gene_type:complete